MTGSELVASCVEAVVVDASSTLDVGELTEIEQSLHGFWGAASLELDAEELTDTGAAGAAAALRRAASWGLVRCMIQRCGHPSVAVPIGQEGTAQLQHCRSFVL